MIIDNGISACDDYIKTICIELDLKDKTILDLSNDNQTLQTCILALNKFNADLTFESKSLREINCAIAKDLSNDKKIDQKLISTLLQQYIDKINKQNHLRLNKRDLKEAQILDEYLKKNKKENLNKINKNANHKQNIHSNNQNDLQSYRSGQTSSTYQSIDYKTRLNNTHNYNEYNSLDMVNIDKNLKDNNG